MKRSGTADLPLHNGSVPDWLYQRMAKLGFAITEAILTEYGKEEFLRKMSNPFWFQSLGAVMGMDWHSSGITTSVLGALRRAINPHSKELGLYFCGGKGKFSRQTPNELFAIADKTGLNGNELVRSSRLSAKVDNNAMQDGFQLYIHSFILADTGQWTVVQQPSGFAAASHVPPRTDTASRDAILGGDVYGQYKLGGGSTWTCRLLRICSNEPWRRSVARWQRKRPTPF